MSRQQTFLAKCQECGEVVHDQVDYTPDSHSFYFCEDCTDKLESRAHFQDELAEMRMSKCAEGSRYSEGYTWSQVKQPEGKIVKHQE